MNILLVVDLQNGFIENPKTKQIAEKIGALLERNDKFGFFQKIITTKFINTKNSVYEKFLNWHKMQNEFECELFSPLKKRADLIIEKNIYNCINDEFLARICAFFNTQNNNFNNKNCANLIEQIFLAGLDTDCCVQSIATTLFERGIRPIVLSQFCGSNGGESSHNAGLLCLRRLIGAAQISDSMLLESSDLADLRKM